MPSVNYSYNIGESSLIQRQGIINLIPKENKPRQKITNYRPICLLNTVYKIDSASIANRIKTVIDKRICRNQSGFISGRYIGDYTRIVYDLMQFVDEKNIQGLLLLKDFERHINILQQNTSSYKSRWKSLLLLYTERGCKQGDPISQYLFILCAEILAIKIKNNKKFKRIKSINKECILIQYADDTSLILDSK